MSDGVDDSGAVTPGAGEGARTAGAMLREARQAQGMHIAALAAAIKVTPRKLEALEGDRYDELPDATFTRALAQTVCRALKIDAEPVLAKLPQAPARGLEQVSAGINAPFRERGVRRDSGDRSPLSRPVVWGTAALVIAAAVVFWLPARFWSPHWSSDVAGPAPASASISAPAIPASTRAAPASDAASAEPVPASATVPSGTASAGAPGASGPVAARTLPASSAVVATPLAATAAVPQSPATLAPVDGLLVQTTTGPSWIEVRDAGGALLISRLVAAGESVTLNGQPPLRVKIGHAAVTRLTYRGKPVPLSPADTVVRLELK